MHKDNSPLPYGHVSIIGSGPGDPELLTVKALRRLQEADTVVYDRLVSPEILALSARGAVRIYAGKSCKHKAMTQEEINSILVTLAKKRKRVVRLKGGDPFIFGRGGEEAAHLAKHAIPFEIIPGISAASGCSSYAGIPLTHRGLANSVQYITGHAAVKGEPARLNWDKLADPDTTLVVYMGLAHIDIISNKLITHGLDPDTPAAAIQQATIADQRVIIGSLHEIAEKIRKARMESPVTVIIGRVVEMAEVIAWFRQETIKKPQAQLAINIS